MLALTIPTIFTASDRLTPFFVKAGKNLATFTEKVEVMAARSNRAFNKLTPTLSETGKKLLETAEEAVGAAALVGGIMFSAKSLTDYDTAIASLHGKLSNLTEAGFSKYQQKVNDVANDTRMSSIEVAGAFEKITMLNKGYAATADSLGEVAKGSILLSKINKTDLATSADSLVGVMNLYKLAADQSDRAVNVLAASEAKHASSITDTMAGLTAFGPVAKHYNVSLEQSVGLLDLLAENQIKGEDAGTKLTQSVIKLQNAHAGYQSGVFNLSDALVQVRDRLAKFTTAKERDNFISALFGKRQQATGILLLENIDKIRKYTQSVTGSTEAERLAGIQENTLSGFVERLKNQWINLITRQDSASTSLNILKGIIGFVTDHLSTIVTIGAGVLAFFALWKIGLMATNVYLAIYNGLMATTAVETAAATTATAAQTVVVGGFGTMLSGVTAELELANTAATGFFATLSEFVIPAALAAMAGWSLWSAFKEYQADQHHYASGPDVNRIPFGKGTKEESAFDKWTQQILKTGKMMQGVDYSNNGLAATFAQLYAADPNAKNYRLPTAQDSHPLNQITFSDFDPKAPQAPARTIPLPQNTNNTISITLHDPGNTVKDIKTTGILPINVKVTNTQGQK